MRLNVPMSTVKWSPVVQAKCGDPAHQQSLAAGSLAEASLVGAESELTPRHVFDDARGVPPHSRRPVCHRSESLLLSQLWVGLQTNQ